METSKITVKSRSGSYNLLDKKYNNSVKNYLSKIDEDTYDRWLIYDEIINEFICLNKIKYFEEFKYRFTGGEDPNDILLDIIERESDIKNHMWYQLIKIKDYKNEDNIKRFYY